jgi:DNA gyrase/topoisomerase IV subunit A
MGVKEITDELEELAGKIKDYLDILRSRERIMAIISDELPRCEKFAVPRRTEIVDWSGDMEDEDLIEREDMVVTVTASGGYIKRTPLAEFRAQRRGGKGCRAAWLKEDDVVTTLFVANTHTPLLFFTTDGMVYKLKTWRLPSGGRTARARRSSTSCRSRRASASPRSCPWTAREDRLGRAADRLRHLGRRRAAQRAVGFHQRHAQRQDRDEAARGCVAW